MAIFTTADGRQIVGAAQAGNEYKGYATKRDITIQLTANGATQDSLDALEYLKAYALYANSVGKSVFPPTTSIYISNNGTTKTVEADDITVDGQNISIGGCVWNGTAWDFTNAGQSGGGGSSGGVYTANITWSEDFSTATLDKTWQEIYDACIHGPVFLLGEDSGGRVVYTVYKVVQMFETGKYTVFTYCGPDPMEFEADTNTGYPAFSDNKQPTPQNRKEKGVKI